MFTQSLLLADLAQHRQRELLRRAERRHRLTRPTLHDVRPSGSPPDAPPGQLHVLPTAAARTSPDEARVA